MGRLTSRPTAHDPRSSVNSLDSLPARAVLRLSISTLLACVVINLLACFVSTTAAAGGAVPARQDLDDVTIAGRAADANGASVAGARVTATLKATGASRAAVTDEEGRYRLVELAPGEYAVRVVAAGFAEETRGNLVAVAGQSVRVDFALRPAGVAAEQTVTDEADDAPAVVDTARTVVGATLTRAEIERLPLSSRAPLDLVFTLPGVTEEPLATRGAAEDRAADNSRTAARRAQTPEEAGAFALAGGPAYSNNITTDGLDNNDDRAARERFQPSLEAVAEVQVITNQFSAEYGRASGGRVNLRTRSGSRQLRGRLFYFFRDESLDANTFFNNARALPRLPLQRHTGGFTLGGPFALPHKFFGARGDDDGGEAQRAGVLARPRASGGSADSSAADLSAGVPSATVTSAAAPSADVSSEAAGSPEAAPSSAAGPTVRRRARTFFFTSYEFDTSLDSTLIDTLVPVRQNPLFALPPPTTLAGRRAELDATEPHAPAELAPFVATVSTPQRASAFLARLDHNFSAAHDGALLYQRGRLKNLRQFGGGSRLASALQGRTRDSDALAYTDNFVISPRAVNQLRAQVSRLAPALKAGGGASRPVVLIDINDPVSADDPVNRSGTLVAGSANAGASDRRETRWQIQDSLTIIGGAHTFKAGFDFQRVRSVFVDLADASGTFTFTSASDFLADAPARFRQRFNTESAQGNTYAGLFAQEEWRARPNLVLTFGLRHEHETIIRDRNNFAPRLALAYDPFGTGHTVVRLGAGVFYNRVLLRTVDDFTLGRQRLFFDTDALSDPATGRALTDSQRRAFIAAHLRFPAAPAADSTLVRQFGSPETEF